MRLKRLKCSMCGYVWNIRPQEWDPLKIIICPKCGYIVSSEDILKEACRRANEMWQRQKEIPKKALMIDIFPPKTLPEKLRKTLSKAAKPEMRGMIFPNEEKSHKAMDAIRELCTCEICGYQSEFGAIEYHHIVPQSITKTLKYRAESERMKLCPTCHKELGIFYGALKKNEQIGNNYYKILNAFKEIKKKKI